LFYNQKYDKIIKIIINNKSMNPTSKSKEILKGNPDEKITLKSIDDLKEQLHIQTLPEEYKNYFEQPLETTRGALIELRKRYLSKQPNNETIKNFLESAKNAIIEKTQSSLEEVKKIE
jgi:hypothetical protein